MDRLSTPLQSLGELKRDLGDAITSAKELGYQGISIDVSIELASELNQLINGEKQLNAIDSINLLRSIHSKTMKEAGLSLKKNNAILHDKLCFEAVGINTAIAILESAVNNTGNADLLCSKCTGNLKFIRTYQNDQGASVEVSLSEYHCQNCGAVEYKED